MELARYDIPTREEMPFDKQIARLLSVRERTVAICAPLAIEDHVVQPIPEVSPPKWHLGHTTWFFEQFILERYHAGYRRHHDYYPLLFNSYYKSSGPHWLQPERGMLSRPTVAEVHEYRAHVDGTLIDFLQGRAPDSELHFLVELGIHHEQQHQELLFMDIKYILGVNPSKPAYGLDEFPEQQQPSGCTDFDAGLYSIGASEAGFAFDNERPRHRVWLDRFSIDSTLVTNLEYAEFIANGGYADPSLWLSAGWDWINRHRVEAPLYWTKVDGEWQVYTLAGPGPMVPNAPVCHVSYFEADAYARWKGCRLPTEQEFEIFLNNRLEPQAVWAWTQSHYSPYPGFTPFPGNVGEYNGKFMCGQFVLRGGCFATPLGHYRPSYRNFFEPQQRWMFSGIRLARQTR